MNGPGPCLLCGSEGDTRIALIEWAVPSDRIWDAIPRCRDVAACKERVVLLHEPWPLAERAR